MDSISITNFYPGRVRLKVTRVKVDPAFAARVRQDFLAIPGVLSIEANPVTGSVLLCYDTRRILNADASLALAHVIQAHFPSLDPDKILEWLKVST